MASLNITNTITATCSSSSTSVSASSGRKCRIAVTSDPNDNDGSAVIVDNGLNGSRSNAIITNDQKGDNTTGNNTTNNDTAGSAKSNNGTSMGSFCFYNGDPVHIYAMIRQCTEGSPEWVVWDDWREFLGLPETPPHSLPCLKG